MKAIQVGCYCKPNAWAKQDKGRVYDPKGISPTLLAGMGEGGNIIPTIIIEYENQQTTFESTQTHTKRVLPTNGSNR